MVGELTQRSVDQVLYRLDKLHVHTTLKAQCFVQDFDIGGGGGGGMRTCASTMAPTTFIDHTLNPHLSKLANEDFRGGELPS